MRMLLSQLLPIWQIPILLTSSIMSIVSLNTHHGVTQDQDDIANCKLHIDIIQFIGLRCSEFGLNRHSRMSKLHRQLPQRSDSLFGRYGINIIAINSLIRAGLSTPQGYHCSAVLIVITENCGIDKLACVDARVVSLTIRLCVICSNPGSTV